jgi:4a-hydroxytetrahydrobiopterin dehydratase
MADRYGASEFSDRHDLPGWRVVDDGIEVWWRAGSFSDAGAFVAEIAALADAANHHPDLSLSYPGRVHVRLTSHDAGGLTDRDASLAAQISAAAAPRGVTVDWDEDG